MSDDGVVVIRRADVPEAGAAIVDVNEELAIAVFRVRDSFYAIDNRCPHKGGPLGEGSLEEMVVTCPWHGFVVDVRSGVCPRTPWLRVRTFPVELRGDDVRIRIAASRGSEEGRK